MTRKALLLLPALLLLTVPAVAQPHGPAPGAGYGPGAGADPSAAFTVLGTVSSFTASVGAGMPALVVEDAALGTVDIGLGPIWFLREAGFSAAAGDQVEALVFPCPNCSFPNVAMWVENLTGGTFVELRGDDGLPLWRQRQGTGGGRPFCPPAEGDQLAELRGGHGGTGGNGGTDGNAGTGGNGGQGANGGQGGPNGPGDGQGPGAGQGEPQGPGAGQGEPQGPGAGQGEPQGPGAGQGEPQGPGAGEGPHGPNGSGPGAGQYPGDQCQWAGPDMEQAATVTGTVVSLEVGFATRSRPSVILEVAGEEMEIYLIPYAPIAAAGFLIEPGTELEITYAPWNAFGEDMLVALAVTDPVTGVTVQLRDPETGYPVTGGGGGFGPHFGYGPGPDGNQD